MGKEYEAIAKEWLEKAESDFQYANASFEAFDDFYSQMCVLCHDAGEKYLKAYIISLGKKPGKIHDLVTLYNQCVENEGSDSELTGLREGCKILNRYYIPLKYPSHYPAIDVAKAREAMSAIKKIREVIKERIG